jgi:ergothioneine biosynthesis protein EgtB
VTRPGLAEIRQWRSDVDARVEALLAQPLAAPAVAALAPLLELGLQHEQQHQELILTDIKHLLSCNPLDPVYAPNWPLTSVAPVSQGWIDFDGGLVEIGHRGEGFAFDNETPRHGQLLAPFALSRRLVTHGDWAAFIADGAYGDPRWWLAAGWDWVRAHGVGAPLYWQREGSGEYDWSVFTLHGRTAIDAHTPVAHINLFEADAFARWWSAQHPGEDAARLPTEAEWEHAALQHEADALAGANFVESAALHPLPVQRVHGGPLQLFGDLWQWTSSSYAPYPGFKPWQGAVGEYNAKFMINQYVLRGGSCATPRSHFRASYRNFFAADARWQFSGLRLARDA